MIKAVKVSLPTVKAFRLAVTQAKDYSPQFEKGISCLTAFLSYISKQTPPLQKSIEKIEKTRTEISSKIKVIEGEIANCTTRLNTLNEKLDTATNELSATPATNTYTEDNGSSREYPNPTYASLQAQISALKTEINACQSEIIPLQGRRDRANKVDMQLSCQIEAINSTIAALSEKSTSCKKLLTELTELKNKNAKRGASAYEGLRRIETLISSYMGIKMTYDTPTLVSQGFDAGLSSNAINNNSVNNGININIKLTETITNEQIVEQFSQPEIDQVVEATVNEEKPAILPADIKKHNIKFDDEGRICLYDNKTFGGTLNSYEDRLKRTSAEDNPVLGYYEGDRGESKFVPSRRTADGIVVLEILRTYGLNGIEYRNAEPDFEVCSEAVVTVPHMSENRENYTNKDGIPTMGNFTQADIECAALWNKTRKDNKVDWCGRDVLNYRKSNGLTWHEKCDMETMVLVKTEINEFFKHSGGCSECKARDAATSEEIFDE